MPIMNDEELNAMLLIDLQSIIDEVTNWLYEVLLDTINDEVYNAGSPQWYERNLMKGGLLGSFDKSDAIINGQKIQSKINHNPRSMVQHRSGNVDDFTHGSEFWIMDDIRKLLAEIIIEGKSGPLFGEGYWREPRDFWTPMEDLLKNGEVDKQIEKAFDKRNIIWKKF
jgi:hypothetical protein